jgi:hypothetical protein
LEKKRKKEAERRHKYGIATPPDYFSLPVAGVGGGGAAKKKTRRKGKRNDPSEESDLSVSEGETNTKLNQGESHPNGIAATSASAAKGGATGHSAAVNKRYASVDSAEGHDSAASEGEDGPDLETAQDAEMSPIDRNEDDEDDEGNSDDSDSLDAMLKGLSHKLRQQTDQPAPKNGGAQFNSESKLSVTNVSTRSSSAGANDSPMRTATTRHTASSGGTDARTITADGGFSPRGMGMAFERADITSAHEHFDELMENFQADDFFKQSSVVQLLRTNESGELVEGLPDSAEEGFKKRPGPASSRLIKSTKAKVSTGPTKKMVIPKHLQNTPYFKHYQKHTDNNLLEGNAAAQPSNDNDGHFGSSFKASSKVPLLARKKQLAAELQSAALAGSVSAPILLDNSMLKFQQSQQMK